MNAWDLVHYCAGCAVLWMIGAVLVAVWNYGAHWNDEERRGE